MKMHIFIDKSRKLSFHLLADFNPLNSQAAKAWKSNLNGRCWRLKQVSKYSLLITQSVVLYFIHNCSTLLPTKWNNNVTTIQNSLQSKVLSGCSVEVFSVVWPQNNEAEISFSWRQSNLVGLSQQSVSAKNKSACGISLPILVLWVCIKPRLAVFLWWLLDRWVVRGTSGGQHIELFRSVSAAWELWTRLRCCASLL